MLASEEKLEDLKWLEELLGIQKRVVEEIHSSTLFFPLVTEERAGYLRSQLPELEAEIDKVRERLKGNGYKK